MNIAEQINSSVEQMISSGKLTDMINKELESSLQKAVKSTIESFFSWGDGNQRMEESKADSNILSRFTCHPGCFHDL